LGVGFWVLGVDSSVLTPNTQHPIPSPRPAALSLPQLGAIQ
jgi:hypothetical protein